MEKGCEYNKELKYNIYADLNIAKGLIVLDYLLDTLENLNPQKCFDKQCTFLFSEFNQLIDAEPDTDKYFKQYCEYLLQENENVIFTENRKKKLLLEIYHQYHLMLEEYHVEYKNVINRLLLCISKLLGNCNLKLK